MTGTAQDSRRYRATLHRATTQVVDAGPRASTGELRQPDALNDEKPRMVLGETARTVEHP